MPDLAFSSPPARIATAPAPNRSDKPADAFFRDLQICPDGSCVLATAEDRSVSLFALPSDVPDETPTPSTSAHTLDAAWTYSPPDSLFSSAWYPGATSADPAMFSFAVGVKDHPVHLLDGADQRVRASYPIVDHTERFVAPHSMAFAPNGASLYCGFENAIEIFDVGSPGAEGYRLHTTPTRSSKEGQKGIISSLAFSGPDPTSGSSCLAAGSFSGTVGLYDPSQSNPLVDLLWPSQRGGVTKVLFHPLSPHLLFAASRQSSHLDVWDLRNTSRPSSSGRLRRKARTNQRLGFDIDPSGTWLAAGDQDGQLSIFSAQPLPDELEPVTSFTLADKPLGATVFHPWLPLLLTASGTRTFRHRRRRDSSNSSSSESSEDGEVEAVVDRGGVRKERSEELESASLGLWKLS
ncbi:WD40 repeat domain-containing protein [Rhodotorula paludigena]|uniref:WD40 repeat domain-containing protein n=1 Tax=Rhodotorula paludigena TaxID=86838 RepID=UPI003171278C